MACSASAGSTAAMHERPTDLHDDLDARLQRARDGLDEALDRRHEAHNAYLQASALYVLALAEHTRVRNEERLREGDEVDEADAILRVLEECPTELAELRASLLQEHVMRRR